VNCETGNSSLDYVAPHNGRRGPKQNFSANWNGLHGIWN